METELLRNREFELQLQALQDKLDATTFYTMQTKEQALAKLKKSKFRSSFYLTKAEKAYLTEKGLPTIRRHAVDLLKKKIGAAYPDNDGKQTPMHGHPVFKAMHATAFCCRDCMLKWYRVPKGVALSEEQLERIADFLMTWIEEKCEKQSTN